MSIITINMSQVQHTARLLTREAADLIVFADTVRPDQESAAAGNVLPTEVNERYRQKVVLSHETAQQMLRTLARLMEGLAWALLDYAHEMGCVIDGEIVRDLAAVHTSLDEIDATSIAPSGPIFGGSGASPMP